MSEWSKLLNFQIKNGSIIKSNGIKYKVLKTTAFNLTCKEGEHLKLGYDLKVVVVE